MIQCTEVDNKFYYEAVRKSTGKRKRSARAKISLHESQNKKSKFATRSNKGHRSDKSCCN